MRRSYRVICLGITIIVLMLLSLFLLRTEKNIMGFSILSKGEAANRMAGCDPLEIQECGLSFQDEKLPYDDLLNTFYLYQPDSSCWEGRLTLDSYSHTAFWVSDYTESVVPSGQQKLLICKGNQASMFTVEICNLPVLDIILKDENGELMSPEEIDTQKRLCQYKLFSKDESYGKSKVQNGNAILCLRGASSLGGMKQNLKMILVNENNQTVHKNFLGLRNDDDWVLNSLLSDIDKVREHTAFQLWEQIDQADDSFQAKSADCAYLEMCVNHNYRGLYLLQTRVDAKQVQLNKKTDILYKSKGAGLPENPENQTSLKLIYAPESVQDVWYPIRRYKHVFFPTENARSVTWEDAAAAANLPNLADFFLFKQALYATDNGIKNVFFLADEENDFQLSKIPWDMNYIFGDDYKADGRERTVHLEQWADLWLEDPEMDVLFQLDSQKAALLLSNQWTLLGNTVLSVENVRDIMISALNEIWDSGALRRNSNRWSAIEPNLPYEEWVSRIDQLIQDYEKKWNKLNLYVQDVQKKMFQGLCFISRKRILSFKK